MHLSVSALFEAFDYLIGEKTRPVARRYGFFECGGAICFAIAHGAVTGDIEITVGKPWWDDPL